MSLPHAGASQYHFYKDKHISLLTSTWWIHQRVTLVSLRHKKEQRSPHPPWARHSGGPLFVLVMLQREAFNRRHTKTSSINSSLQSSRRALCTNIWFLLLLVSQCKRSTHKLLIGFDQMPNKKLHSHKGQRGFYKSPVVVSVSRHQATAGFSTSSYFIQSQYKISAWANISSKYLLS